MIDAYETPLTTVLARANKDSMNLYAEALCKRLGYESGKATAGARTRLVGQRHRRGGGLPRKAGVDEKEFALDDGCGLSKHNVISPNAAGTACWRTSTTARPATRT